MDTRPALLAGLVSSVTSQRRAAANGHHRADDPCATEAELRAELHALAYRLEAHAYLAETAAGLIGQAADGS